MVDVAIAPIVAALESGNPLAAERLCRAKLRARPGAADLKVLLALSLWRQGNRDRALEIYAQLACTYPKDIVHWRNYATALRNAQIGMQAIERASETAVQLAPDDPEVLEAQGLLQMELGNPRRARDMLLRAFGASPHSPGIRIHAAQACSACRDYRAEDLLGPWREWLPLEEDLQRELAEVQIQQGEVMAALDVLEDLVRRSPSHVPAQLSLASVYERVNRLDDAEAILQKIEASDAQSDDVHRAIDRQRAQLAERRGDLATAQTILHRTGPETDADYGYWFTLGKLRDKLGDPASAMHAFAIAHARQVEELRVAVPHFLEPGTEILPNVNARVTESAYHDWPKLVAPDVSQSPVFVVGFPRSGTTLLEQMLDAHPRLQSMDERPFFNMLAGQLERSTGFEVPRDLGRLNQRDCDELRKGYLVLACGKVPRRWNTRLVDKNPLNMLWLPLIHRMFPSAKFILALRHPCDVVLSCYMQNFRTAVLAVAGQTLEHLANAYVAAMESWLYHVEVFKPDIFVSRYEDLVADTPKQTREIAAFLDLQGSDAMLKFDERAREKGYIKTPSYTQVIEPINNKAISRWQRYRENFEPILSILQPMLEHWQYATDASTVVAERRHER